ncbi:aspartate aminotransferase family protein [Methylibium petroleiphilum]|uniref:aminotransferase family protein n=1 Tax=Methylibium petroleiphilum TaxID=105560 RepID=UPI001ACA2339|nr:aspartate aminotransferase family protein [Methylibium petroleiphilum]MBN9206957.1 aspartate aminotransferase family protein [Methylibium petroleiphilum]
MGDSLNAALLQRDHRHLVHSLHNEAAHLAGNVWVKGEGTTLTDADGKRYIDAMSGLWNVTLGYGRRELVDAAAAQMGELAYASGYAGSTNLRAMELAEKLAADRVYPNMHRFFFTSGGGESTDSTIKTARYYWKAQGKPGKYKTLSVMGGYHGVTLAAMCATGMPAYWPAFEPRMPGFVHIPNHDAYRYVVPPGADPATAAADELERAILAEGPDTVALFIAEPVMGGGAYVPPAGYFRRIREICDRYDVLFATDEVITGFGRTGKLFALGHWGSDVQPDLVQFAKGITSGYVPMGGVGLSDKVAAVFDRPGADTWMHCYTYSGHPVACAVALATLDVIEREGLLARAQVLGDRLLRGLRGALGDHPNVGDIRGLGLIAAVELVEDRFSKKPFDPARKTGPQVLAQVRQRGVVTRGRGDTVYLGPALVSDEATIDRIVEAVAEGVGAVLPASA